MIMRNAVATLAALLAVAFVSEGLAQTFDSGGLNLLKVKPLAERGQQPDDVAVAVWPSGVIDAEETHYLNQNNLTVMMVAIANPSARRIASSQLVCDLPEGVLLKAVNTNLLWNSRKSDPIQRDGKPYVRHTIELRGSQQTIPLGKLGNCWYARYQPPSLWVSTDLPPGSKPGRVYQRLTYVEEGQKETAQSPESSVDIAVLPALKADVPRIAKSGVMGRGPATVTPYENDAHPEHARLIASYLQEMGCNIHMCGLPASASPAGLVRWTEGRNIGQISTKGFRHNLNEPVGVGDGFFIHLTREMRRAIPQEIQRLNQNGDRVAGGMMSPWAIYRRHPWIQKNVLDVIAGSIERGDYQVLWANWEPRMSDLDYSDGSKREFIAWSKLPKAEVEQLWLDELVKKYPKQWWEFRNWELGQVVKTYSDVIRQAGEKAGRPNTRFMFCLPQDCMVLDDDVNVVPWQALRWGDMPGIMQTWSYHHTPRSNRRFPSNDKMIHYMVQRCGWVRRYVDEKLGEDRDVLLGCTYGWEQTGGRAGFFVPEDLAFRHLSGPMGGMDVAINYAEWTVWDGRYASELARANTRIARWENYTLKGKTQSQHVVIPVSPYPQQIPQDASPADHIITGGWPGGRYVHSQEYEQEGSRLIAVANNWHFGDCFLKLRVFDLDADKQYVLWEPEENRAFANSEGSVALSAEELAEGLLVHVGATRWGAFLVEPFQEDKDYGSAVLSGKVKEVLEQRRDGLEQSLTRSAAFQ